MIGFDLIIGVTCKKCDGSVYEVGRIIAQSFIKQEITEHVLAKCVNCCELVRIERIWIPCQITYEENAPDDQQTKI